jgi:hypothetical protein
MWRVGQKIQYLSVVVSIFSYVSTHLKIFVFFGVCVFKRVMRWSVKLRRGGNVGLLVIVVVLTVIGRVRRANPVIVALRVEVLAHAPTVSTAVCVEFLLVVLRDSKQAYALGKCNNRVRGRGRGSNRCGSSISQVLQQACLLCCVNCLLVSQVIFNLAHLVVVEGRRGGVDVGREGKKGHSLG